MNRCVRCRGTEHLIEGDGPAVCFTCVQILAGAAADPQRVSRRLRDMLAEMHGDVLALSETESGQPKWAWL